MQPSRRDHATANGMPASQELPYGPLPVRPRETISPDSLSPDHLTDLTWLAPDEPADLEGFQDRPEEIEENPGSSIVEGVGLSITSPNPETDDDVHFGVAARALGVSRKTVERMVKRGQLERGPSNAPATVSKRALVATLEQRRRDVSHLTRATAIERARSGPEWVSGEPSPDPTPELRELLLPVLAPLLDEFVAVRTRAAMLETKLEGVEARAQQQRTRDELLLALATEGWWRRRRLRRAVLRHYVLGDDPNPAAADAP